MPSGSDAAGSPRGREDAVRADDGGGRVAGAPAVDPGEGLVEGGHRRSVAGRAADRDICRRAAWSVRWMAGRAGCSQAERHATRPATRRAARSPCRRCWPSSSSLAAAATAAATEFPAGKQGYHSYTEMTAEVAAVAAAHPDIVTRFSIGKSYQGRDLWAVKISDNVAVDEAEPEVMFDGGHHADEHMATEMTLRILHWLVDGYGADPRITNDRGHARGLDRLPGQPRRRRVRHLRWPVPLLAQEPPADARHAARSGRTSTATTAIAGAAAAARARTRRPSPTAGRRRSRRRRTARCATSWPVASSAAGSRSGRRSRSTSPAGWSCGRTATR